MQRSRTTGIFGHTVRPRGFMGMIAALFVATQILCCFHTHSPLHEDDHEQTHQTECDVCLVAHMPVDTGGTMGDLALLSGEGMLEVHKGHHVWTSIHPSLTQARAPPAFMTKSYI